MKMKQICKLTVLIMAVLLLITACTGTNNSSPSASSSTLSSVSGEKHDVNVACLKGPSGLAMAQMLKSNIDGTSLNNYNLTLVGAPDEITAKLTSGDLDIAAVPTNLAANLYNKTDGKVKIIAVSTLGNMYIMSKQEINKIDDLKGKTIVMAGSGAVPQYALQDVLQKSGLEDKVTLEIKSEHSEVAAMIIAGTADVVLLPEPFVTQVNGQSTEIKQALDLNKEWQDLNDGHKLVMGCVVARADFIDKNKDAVDKFLSEYKASIEFCETNTAQAAQYAEEIDIMKAAVAEKAIPNCAITYMDGNEMKSTVNDFLTVLFNIQPKFIGDSIPDENFYYIP